MRAGMRNQTFHISRTQPSTPNSMVSSIFSRNLDRHQLGGVIFGCKNSTMKECQSKQLFGLPAQHFSYVKNIDPGLPIFLFNFSDRKLHGIFEASSKGQMYIDPYAWIDDYSELDRTQYPAQVKFRVRLQCQPLSEDKFAQVIKDNYYSSNHFWFELDHRQASKLISLLASVAFAAGVNSKLRTVTPSLPLTHKNGEAFETPEWKVHHSTSSTRRANTTEIASLVKGMKPLDTPVVVKEVNQNEMNLVHEKLKELALGHESQDISDSNNVNETLDENDICTVEKDCLEMPMDSEEKEESSSSSVEHQTNFDKVVQEVEELKTFKKIQTHKNCCLEEKLGGALLEIQRLMDRCKMLELKFNSPLPHADNTVIESFADQHVDPNESLFLMVDSDGESQLSTMDLSCPSLNVIKSLYLMKSIHSYNSVIQLNDRYSPIFDKWTLCSSLDKKKESSEVISLTNKIFTVSGDNAIDSYSDSELLGLDIGDYVSTHLMLRKRFAPAVDKLNAMLYTTTGGYVGVNYLEFVPDALKKEE